MKLYDCFIYNNEDLILDIRFNTLNKCVDKFILVESKFDHQGNKKKLNFNINKFKEFKNKIEYLVINEFPNNLNNWERENFQRNYIFEGLKDIDSEDYVIISDVDEIPNLENINNLKNHKFTVFKQKNFSFKLNLINKSLPNWFGSRVCKKKYLKSPQWLRDQKVKKYSILKFFKIKWNIVEDGGWHFSYLMDAHGIQNKLKSFAHAEFNNEFYTNIKKINKAIDNQKDLFGRDQKYEKINLDNIFPKYILNNKNKYKDWIV